MKVDTITDVEGTFATVGEAFPAVDSHEQWWLPVNVVLVRDGMTVLIDTGLGPKPRGFVPEPDVDIVLHTHLHVDHVGWGGWFPNACYVVHRRDWEYFMSEESRA